MPWGHARGALNSIGSLSRRPPTRAPSLHPIPRSRNRRHPPPPHPGSTAPPKRDRPTAIQRQVGQMWMAKHADNFFRRRGEYGIWIQRIRSRFWVNAADSRELFRRKILISPPWHNAAVDPGAGWVSRSIFGSTFGKAFGLLVQPSRWRRGLGAGRPANARAQLCAVTTQSRPGGRRLKDVMRLSQAYPGQ